MQRINDYLQGFQNRLPGMKDYRHASRLYIDDNFKLMPKQKFLFHVVFNLDETLFDPAFTANERFQLNMLVKAIDLPKYNMSMEEKIQYNKKMYAATRIAYDPVNITFHDDHADTVNAFWKKYYEYMVADSVSMNTDLAISQTKDNTYDSISEAGQRINKYGLDTPNQRKKPFLKQIDIFVLHKKRFTSMSLINPVIGSFNHDSLDAGDGTGILENQMQVLYETVIYGAGNINRADVPGFATIHYDNEPSPLSVLGGGTNSLFGPGGVVDGVGSVIRNIQSGNILGAILGANNTYRNAKKLKKGAVKEELKGIAKEGVLDIGKQAGTITNPVSAFSVGIGAAAIGTSATIASAVGTADNKTGQNNSRITTPALDTVNYLGANESYNLITTNATLKDEIASGIYYKDIGSRKGLSVAESDIEFAGSSATTKTVYQSKAVTDVRKLVTEGYLKIDRTNQDVSITAEKATL